jgi:hypothetical protein
MDLDWNRFTTDMLARVSGPMKFRLVLQPLMAAFFAIRDGLRDARTGRRPYFSKIATDSTVRKQAGKELWESVGKVFILAVVLDVVYQLWVLKTVYPFQAFVVAVILAILPYLILRGIANRVARREIHRPARSTPSHVPPDSLPDPNAHRQ